MRKPSAGHQPKAEMNVVPYIDVMLVLLVIFMVTAPMLTQGVKVDLPKVAGEPLPEDSQREILTVSVKADGSYYWNLGSEVDIHHRTGEANDMDGMMLAVKPVITAHPELQVYVRADEEAAYGRVVAGMAALQRSGVESLGLVTELPE